VEQRLVHAAGKAKETDEWLCVSEGQRLQQGIVTQCFMVGWMNPSIHGIRMLLPELTVTC
jgi:hypothetical protein